MGNSDNSPNDGKLSLDTSAPLWSAILSEVSKGMPIEGFARVKPKGLVTKTVDAFTGMLPGPTTQTTVRELFLPGTAPTEAANVAVAVDIDQASGLLWQDGCVGPMVTRNFIDFSGAEAAFPAWQKSNRAWQARAAQGPGRRRRAEAHADRLLLRGRVLSVRADLGRRLRAHEEVSARPAAADGLRVARPAVAVSVDRAHPAARARDAHAEAQALRGPGRTPRPGQSLTIVAPSPPSPRSPALKLLTSGCVAACALTASRSAPVPRPWMIRTCSRPASEASSR